MNITLEALCEGLYTPSMMMRIEQEKRKADPLFLERILGRLGIEGESCENYLNPDEYEVWKAGQQILEAIDARAIDEARGKIEQYRKLIGSNKVGLQFCYAMEAQIYEILEKEKEQIGQLYKKAVFLTIPAIEKKKITELCLSVQEWNLVLEYYRYQHPKELEELCIQILEKLKEVPYETIAMAKIYPKVVVYLNRERRKRTVTEEEREESIVYGEKAIEILRDCGRTFYLMELLEIQIENLEKYIEIFEQRQEEKSAVRWRLKKEELEEYYVVLNEISSELELSIRTCNCCHLYRERETYCVSDVIRIRRKMLGMAKEELCDGICSVKTLDRIEKKKSNPQLFVVKGLFQRLHLPPEITRLECLTKERATLQLVSKWNECLCSNDYGKAETFVREIEKYEWENGIENKQSFELKAMISLFGIQKISKNECKRELKRILEYTVPYDCIWEQSECYLTKNEMICLHNIALMFSEEEIKILGFMKMMIESRREIDTINNRISLYEIIGTAYASKLGNIGEVVESNRISRELMEKSLQNGRMFYLDSNIYCIVWNQTEKYVDVPLLNKTEKKHALKTCFYLARMNKKKSSLEFYEDKMSIK